MEVYVKESLHVLDYKDNIVDTIFLSDDHRNAGYAYDITITEANTGYSDLKFNMPNIINDENGNTLKNPKLGLLTPLVKLRYHREVYYMGEQPITVREPQGYGDTVVYVDKVYSNTYPDNVIEDYIMDYIVQPIDKKRDVLKLTTSFTAIDYPRFNLSKKKVGLAISQDTLTKKEWTLYQNKPMDVAGTIKYEQWTKAKFGQYSQVEEWDPENANEYPLNEDSITELMNNTAVWPYGLLGTAFYWPIVSTARFEGQMYTKGGFLVLQLYDFYSLTTEGVDPDKHVGRYSWEWTQLNEVDSYLTPNNACNYLYHILDGTNWSVKLKEDGTPDVDIVKVDIPNPKGSTTSTTKTDHTCNISVSGSNCYNAITAVCQGLQLYPVYDCVNREVSLRVFAGKNYGLVYRLGSNLQSNGVKNDGEKVITKLYVTGGKDYQGDQNINIGEAERSYAQQFNYIDFDNMVYGSINQTTGALEGTTASQMRSNYKTLCEEGDVLSQVNDMGHNMRFFFYDEDDNYIGNALAASGKEVIVPANAYYMLFTTAGSMSVQILKDNNYMISANPDKKGNWNPNAPEYIIKRSPYGTNYILNFKWMYDNGWMSKTDILGLYSINQQINDLNKEFMVPYTEDRLRTLQMYNDAINNYDLKQGEYQSTLNSMMNKYYKVYGQYSEGTFYAFHKAPQGTYTKGGKHYIWIGHCPKCKETWSATSKPTKCTCGETEIRTEELYIPVYSDFPNVVPPTNPQYPYGPAITSAEYEPYLKGDYLKLVTTLDNENGNWSITDYESKVSIITPIDYEGADTDDDREYKIGNVYVKASSGNIEEWNEDIKAFVDYYGEMLDALDTVNYCLEKLRLLEEDYNNWKAQYDGLQAEIQDKYGDYIIEGNYTNNEQPYVGLLFNEGMEASNKYAIPEVTYNLDVIDSSGLMEYRNPMVTKYRCTQCDYTCYTPITVCPKCQSDLIDVVHDTYNDLVHLLHSVGQIVPKAGDYVTIYDEPMGLYGVPGLITEISRTLDKPVNNKIKLDTSYTDDEELVGNIITATNTVLNNADIYARTAVLKADGTIDSQSITKSLDNPNAGLSIVGTNGNMLLTGSSLRFTDPNDSTRAIKYSGTGIFTTTTLSENEEATEWQKMITPTGINATYLNAGQIDTKHISIMSGMTSKILIDQYGLVIKNAANKSAHITSFDADKASKDAGYAAKWGADNNISGFMGVDSDNNAIVYTKGYLVANKGSNIAGWVTDDNSFYHLKSGTNDGTKDLWLSPSGVSGAVNGSGSQAFAIYANGKFGVTTDGTLYASGVHIEGDGTFKGTVTAESGKIAGYTIDGDTLYGSQVGMDAESGGNYAFWAGAAKGSSSSAPFRVGHDGAVTCTNLTATGGTIGGCTISNGTLQIKNANIDTLSVSKITGGSNSATITFSGNITCNNLTAKTSGNIGGWTIHADMLKSSSGNSQLRDDGSAYFYPKAGGTLVINDGFRVNAPGGALLCSTGDYTTMPGNGNTRVHASSNLNLYSGGNTRIETGQGGTIYLDCDVLRVGTGDTKALSTEIVDVDIAYKDPVTLKFVHGILVSVT